MTTIHKTLKFDAAHFVHTTNTPCRNIHGHTWKVELELTGKVQPDGMLVDFTSIKEIVDQLDHKLLVPMDLITWNNNKKYEEHRVAIINHPWGEIIVPGKMVEDLPIETITAEHLAEYIAESILDKFDQVVTVSVSVWESSTARADCTRKRRVAL